MRGEAMASQGHMQIRFIREENLIKAMGAVS